MLALTQGLCHRLPAAALGSLLALSPALARSVSTPSSFDEPDAPHQDRKYVDRLKITARAGKGGNGCASFYQGASRGGHLTADGGSGGDGGNVVVRAVSNMKSLAGVQQLYKAEGGLHGTKQRQHGRAGRDTVVLVPVGTVVHRLRREEEAGSGDRTHAAGSGAAGAEGQGGQQEAPQLPEWLQRWRRPFSGAVASDLDNAGSAEDDIVWWDGEEGAAGGSSTSGSTSGSTSSTFRSQREEQQLYEFVADLTEHGQEVAVARGAPGGRGNAGVKARAHRPAPAETERGQPGEVSRLLLELKLLADVGLVGLPNAGKSTLLRALTAATPRVADYAFTTLAPQLGVVAAPSPADDPIVVADIPGLIRGAHENRGLGHNFLRHIERTKAIAYVLDCQSGTSGRPGPKPWEQLLLLQAELAAYSPHLAQLPALVIANKLDTLAAPGRTLAALRRRTELQIVAVSAKEQATLQARAQQVPKQQQQRQEQAGGQQQQQQQHDSQAKVHMGGSGAGSDAQSLEKAAAQAAKPKVAYSWSQGLRPLHFRLAQLLHQAGARQHAPDWREYAAAP